MSSRFAGRSQTPPGFVTPGATNISGHCVASSQSVNFRQCSFSPRCQPWSPHRTMIVFLALGPLSSASSTRPTQASAKAIDARYPLTALRQLSVLMTLAWSPCGRAIFLPIGGTSSRSFFCTFGSVTFSGGNMSKYFFGTYQGRWGRKIPTARNSGLSCFFLSCPQAQSATFQSPISSSATSTGPQSKWAVLGMPFSGRFGGSGSPGRFFRWSGQYSSQLGGSGNAPW
jgi:hypothetical protein